MVSNMHGTKKQIEHRISYLEHFATLSDEEQDKEMKQNEKEIKFLEIGFCLLYLITVVICLIIDFNS